MNGPAQSLHVLMLLGSFYPPPQGGGTQMQVRLLAKALRKRGHRVTVLAPLVHAGERRVDRLDGVPICRLAYPRVRFLAGPWLTARLCLFLLSRRNRYDAWHVHSPRLFGAVAALLGSRCEKPVVVVKVASANEFETGTLSRRPSLRRRAFYACLKRADAWQAISRRIAGALAARGIPEARIAAIPNAVDVGWFSRVQRSYTHAPRFVFIGRLVAPKNLFLLLDAFAGLLRTHPAARLRIVGGGPLEAALKQRANTLEINTSVEFSGHREDIAALLADADFGVLPSTFEGLSNVLLESMASGLPMIASRVSGSEDFVHAGKNGWLFEPNDAAQLTQCLVEAANLSPRQRQELGAQARETIERHASVDRVLEQIMLIYRRRATPSACAAPSAGEVA